MELSTKNLRSTLGKDLLKVAGRCVVRECDENPKGKFVAYVDEASDSFDVAVEKDDSGKFITYSCDCKSERKICQHIAALMLFVSSAQKIKVKQAPRQKVRESELIADEIDPALLLEWIKERLKNDKEFELAFVSAFRPTKLNIDPERLGQMMTDAQKAVIGRNRNLEARLLARLLALWSKVIEPVMNHYIDHPADSDAFNGYTAILDHLMQFPEQYYFNSGKYYTYVDELKDKGFAAVHAIADDHTWRVAIGHYMVAAFIPGRVGRFLMDKLILLIDSNSRERRIFLTESLVTRFKNIDESERRFHLQLGYQLLKLTVDQGMFDKFETVFDRQLNYAPYDALLVDTLITLGRYDKAITISSAIAFSEVYPERQLQQLKLLKFLYQKTGNTSDLLKVLKILVPMTYQFEDFKFLSEHLGKADFENMKSSMFHKAISSMHARRDMFDFVFNLLAEEKDYGRMIRYLSKTQSYESVIPWVEVLAEADKDACFTGLLQIPDIHFNQSSRNSAEQLASLVMELYPVEYIRSRLFEHLSKYRYMQLSTYTRILAQRFEFS